MDAYSEADLLRALLDLHEAGHWDRINRQRGLGLDLADQRTAVAVATLLTAEGVQEALTVARLIPHLGHDPESRLIAVARWLGRLYSPSGESRGLSIAPLEPDRLGEVLVGDVLREYPSLLAAAIDAASDRQLARALTVATRAAREDDTVSLLLRDALDDRLGDLLERGINAEGSDLLNPVTAAMTAARPARGALDAAAEIPTTIPVGLRPLAAAVTALAVDGLREQDDSDPAVIGDLAGWLSSLSSRLSALGELEEALRLARESTEYYRQLAQADAAAYLPDLAMALINLAARLGEAGEQQSALEIAGEAAGHYRGLADANLATYLPGLGRALNNLGILLGQAGHRAEALPVAREAAEIRRELAHAAPANHLPDLATSLTNLGNLLGEAGDRDEALRVAREAAEIRRELARAAPAAELPDLAMALTNLATALHHVGEQGEALRVAREAAGIYSELAQANPAAWLPEQAMALNNLGSFLRDVGERDAGEREEGLRIAREAVDIYWELAQTSPAAWLPGLARAMINLANRLGEAGEQQSALEVAREAIEYYRELARTNPAAYLPSLAGSLINLTALLSMAGEWQAALLVASEATEYYRELARTNPAAHLPGLAMALTNLARALRDAGEQEESLAVARESTAYYRELAGTNPAYLPGLGASLSNLAAALSAAGDQEEALAVAREAAEHHRALAAASRAAHLPGLGASLGDLAAALRDAGEQEEALQVAREAVAIGRELAQVGSIAYLSGLAGSLDLLADLLSKAGQADQAEDLFAEILGSFPDGAVGTGHILQARGTWRTGQGRLAEAIPDLTRAVEALARDGDLAAHGKARQTLRALRGRDTAAFDQAWEQTSGPLPVWLQHLNASLELFEKFLAWIDCSDWDASRAYLQANASDLLTDEAEALIEFIADRQPAVDQLPDYLHLQKAARAYGIDAAYTSWREQRLAQHLIETLWQWLETPSWTASQAFVSTRSDELLYPGALAILDAQGNQDPADIGLRLHRGLLAYASTAGLDDAYDLLHDGDRQQAMIADSAIAGETRLAIARMHSGLVNDDPEAHFQLAALILLAILTQADPSGRDVAPALAREAAAVLADCATNAAPYEQRDFARRLAQLTADHPPLAPYLPELRKQLITREMPAPDPSQLRCRSSASGLTRPARGAALAARCRSGPVGWVPWSPPVCGPALAPPPRLQAFRTNPR